MSENVRKNILDVISGCDVAQFCTFGLVNYPETRTIANMLNKNKDNIEDLTLYFFTNKYSHKIEQIKNNNNVCLYYYNLKTRHSMTLFGNVKIIFDQNEKEKFWTDELFKFDYTGKSDESYCVIKFIPKIYKYYIGKEEKTGKIL